MANYYSDLISSDRAIYDKGYIPEVSTSRFRYRNGRIHMQPTYASGDVLRLATLKETDRIEELILSSENTFSGGLANFGIYESGKFNDGPVVDATLFASAIATAAQERVNIFKESGKLGDTDRAQPLWSLLDDYGSAGYLGVKPGMLFDLCMTLTSNVTGNGSLLLEVGYVSGD